MDNAFISGIQNVGFCVDYLDEKSRLLDKFRLNGADTEGVRNGWGIQDTFWNKLYAIDGVGDYSWQKKSLNREFYINDDRELPNFGFDSSPILSEPEFIEFMIYNYCLY